MVAGLEADGNLHTTSWWPGRCEHQPTSGLCAAIFQLATQLPFSPRSGEDEGCRCAAISNFMLRCRLARPSRKPKNPQWPRHSGLAALVPHTACRTKAMGSSNQSDSRARIIDGEGLVRSRHADIPSQPSLSISTHQKTLGEAILNKSNAEVVQPSNIAPRLIFFSCARRGKANLLASHPLAAKLLQVILQSAVDRGCRRPESVRGRQPWVLQDAPITGRPGLLKRCWRCCCCQSILQPQKGLVTGGSPAGWSPLQQAWPLVMIRRPRMGRKSGMNLTEDREGSR
jgi:hypothetical protein